MMADRRLRPRIGSPVGRGRRWALLTGAAAIAAAATLGGATPVAASRTAAGSCTPISPTQARSILALVSSLQMRNTLDKVGGPLHSECNAVAWSGPTPTSTQAAFQLARSGHGAQFGIEAWHPNPASPDVGKWKSKDYGALTDEFQTGAATFPGLLTNSGWPSKRIKPRPSATRPPASWCRFRDWGRGSSPQQAAGGTTRATPPSASSTKRPRASPWCSI